MDPDSLKISENDQLMKIVEQVSELNENDFSFLSDNTAI